MGKYVMKKSVMITVMLSCILALSGDVYKRQTYDKGIIVEGGVTILKL